MTLRKETPQRLTPTTTPIVHDLQDDASEGRHFAQLQAARLLISRTLNQQPDLRCRAVIRSSERGTRVAADQLHGTADHSLITADDAAMGQASSGVSIRFRQPAPRNRPPRS